MLPIIYENKNLIAINKPHGLLVHRSNIAKDATRFAVQILRDQIGQQVYPVHRLDRKTAGVLLFAKSKAANRQMQGLFMERKVKKQYQAIVRGFTPPQGEIDYALKASPEDTAKPAQSQFTTLQHFEIPISSGKHPTSRYSLVQVQPLTGRFHQIRKHFAHIFHPIIGDRPHGCNKQNRFWKNHFQMITMLLHAESLAFTWINEDGGEEEIYIEAEVNGEFKRVLGILEEGLIN